jgi:hypothetical protein
VGAYLAGVLLLASGWIFSLSDPLAPTPSVRFGLAILILWPIVLPMIPPTSWYLQRRNRRLMAEAARKWEEQLDWNHDDPTT